MLLFDRNLEAIQITGDEVNVTVVNSGRGIELEVSHDSGSRLTISRGPLDYEYTLDHIIVHYGQSDNIGSEHTISGHPFPGEVQLFAFNSQLYANWSESSNAINGIAAISVLIQLSNPDHPDDNQQMKRIISAMRDKSAAAKSQSLSIISIKDLLPSSNHYITYEGSLTQPSCSENVQWIIVNRPLYVSSHRMKFIRNLVNGHASNFRPIQQLRRRCIRTNINFRESSETNETNKSCNMNTFSAIYTTSLEKLDSLDEVGQSAAILLGQR
ncbi:Carbonic anhydrase-related protein 10 [Halotydeus destructor]|nr:Carbonic anhydrase-related protein 10 [Halotydeus destructor]